MRRRPVIALALCVLLAAARGSAGFASLFPSARAFLFPTAVIGGPTTVRIYYARQADPRLFRVAYSYSVAVRNPAAHLAYLVEVFASPAQAEHAALLGQRASALHPLPLARAAAPGAWLRGLISARYCALAAGGVFRNLVLTANMYDTYPKGHTSRACRGEVSALLALERRLLARAREAAVA